MQLSISQDSDWSTGPGLQNKSRNLSTHVSFLGRLWPPLYKMPRALRKFSCNPLASIAMACMAKALQMNSRRLVRVFSRKSPSHGSLSLNQSKSWVFVVLSLEPQWYSQDVAGCFL